MAAETGKLSFAKVAASATKKEVSTVSRSIVNGSKSPPQNETAKPPSNGSPQPADKAVDALQKDVQSLDITPSIPAMLSRKQSETSSLPNSLPTSDVASQKADSSSELGTKPPSLDGKSITSGTTFNALDEKESLRPDDSASVKAATDEDDAFSIRGSLLISSRFGSDVAPRGQRMIQIGDMPPRILPSVSQEPAISSNVTPSSSSEQQPVTEARVQLATSTAAPPGASVQYPDEKLLEAMQSQKDRLFLLRLENDVVNFVQNSKEPFMDLPPSNSFCRMLTHKLADYYHMTHSFEAVAGSVRIYRTPFCRVPPALGSFVPASTPSSETPAPVIQPKKIMRRGEEFEATSSGPSKATSEVDSDSKDKAPIAKEKMSREEREEAYIKARERIFGTTTEVSTPENDDGTGISRASSVSAKDKAAASKKNKPSKQRRDDSESFDSRSQYTLLYNHQQTTWVMPQFFNGAPIPIQPQPPHPAQAPQHPAMAPQHAPPYVNAPMQAPIAYGIPGSSYPQPMPPNGVGVPPPAGAMPYPPQQMPPRHGPQGGQPAYPYPPQQPQAAGPPQWQQSQVPPYNNAAYPPAQGRPGPPVVQGSAPGNVGTMGNMMYAFGQLPANFNPNDPKSQHPIPGSYAGNYSRHGFNPKTQSFVPGTGPTAGPGMPIPGMPGPPGPYGPMGMPVPGPMPVGMSTSPYGGSTTSNGFGMMRQGSAGFHDPYGNANHGPPHGPPHGAPLGPSHGPHHSRPPHHANKPAGPQPPSGPKNHQQQGQAHNNLPQYGNPATLPQKPTTT